jgi:hypothetical protein
MSRTRNTVLEYNRLAYEEGWNLAGIACTTSRTRNAGSGRPKRALEEQSSSTDSDYEADEESASEQEEVAVEEDFTDEELEEEVAAVLVEDQDDDAKPQPTRLLLELESLKKCMEKHCRCLKCNGPVKMEVKTLCIASNVMVYCIDKGCGYVDVSDVPATAEVRGITGATRERTTDFAINVLYVLGFLVCGDGSTEAGRTSGWIDGTS